MLQFEPPHSANTVLVPEPLEVAVPAMAVVEVAAFTMAGWELSHVNGGAVAAAEMSLPALSMTVVIRATLLPTATDVGAGGVVTASDMLLIGQVVKFTGVLTAFPTEAVTLPWPGVPALNVHWLHVALAAQVLTLFEST